MLSNIQNPAFRILFLSLLFAVRSHLCEGQGEGDTERGHGDPDLLSPSKGPLSSQHQ